MTTWGPYGGEWIGLVEGPHDGSTGHGGSIPPASTTTEPTPLVGTVVADHRTRPPVAPTWEWGDEYPCKGYKLTPGQQAQCIGWMQPGARFTHEGRYWRHFKCKTCGREATDLVARPKDLA